MDAELYDLAWLENVILVTCGTKQGHILELDKKFKRVEKTRIQSQPPENKNCLEETIGIGRIPEHGRNRIKKKNGGSCKT